MILKLAAASAAAYGLYRLISQRSDDSANFQPADTRSPVPVSATTPVQGGPYVSPV